MARYQIRADRIVAVMRPPAGGDPAARKAGVNLAAEYCVTSDAIVWHRLTIAGPWRYHFHLAPPSTVHTCIESKVRRGWTIEFTPRR